MTAAHLMPEAPPSARRVIVLGAGITGLTAAWRLQQAGFEPIVLEKSSRVGGSIGALKCDGWLHELGPNSLMESSPAVGAFVDELGLGDRKLYASGEAQQRYIVRGGRLVAMPTSPWGFLSTKLFSWRAKLGLIGELAEVTGDAGKVGLEVGDARACVELIDERHVADEIGHAVLIEIAAHEIHA